MHRKVVMIVSGLFWVIIVAAFLAPPAGNSFWYSDLDKITEYCDEDTAQNLHNYLLEEVLPDLDRNLELLDNREGDNGVTVYKKGRAWEGYTLLSSIRGHKSDKKPPAGVADLGLCGVILIDMEGNIVNDWPLLAVPAKMLPGGHILGMAITPANGPPVNGIQTLMQMDWYGNEVWRWSGPPGVIGGARVHHDFQREGNPVGYYVPGQNSLVNSGKTLVLSMAGSPPAGTVSAPGISNFLLQEEAIYEVAADGAVLWSWIPSEHFDQMGFDEAAKDAIMTVRVMGIGGVAGDPNGPTDWQHINSTSYLGPNEWYANGDLRFHPDNIIYDSRTANYIAIIARHDNPGKWVAGDIVWRVGPHYSQGYNESRIGQIIGPHMAHMIPRHLPGAGNILVFDNGGVAGYGSLLPGMPGTYPATFRDYSRIIEFDPITFKTVWEYTCPEKRTLRNRAMERKFYSRLISGAQRLPNGNTLITEGAYGRVFEVSRRGEIVWEYIHKEEYADGQGPVLGFLPNTAIYRAYRVPKQWVPRTKEYK